MLALGFETIYHYLRQLTFQSMHEKTNIEVTGLLSDRILLSE